MPTTLMVMLGNQAFAFRWSTSTRSSTSTCPHQRGGWPGSGGGARQGAAAVLPQALAGAQCGPCGAGGEGHVVILSVGTQRFGFVVDQWWARKEVVIKHWARCCRERPACPGRPSPATAASRSSSMCPACSSATPSRALSRSGTSGVGPVPAPSGGLRRPRLGVSTYMPVKVLVVDDSGFFRRRLKEILAADPTSRWWARPATGGRGRPGPGAATDVITMDYEMPMMDGITAVANHAGSARPGADVLLAHP